VSGLSWHVGEGAAPEVPWNEHGLRGVPRPDAADWRNEPTSGVLEPHALGGIPGVVGFAPLEARGTGKRC
jgi:hypothetical protein